jgi:hypothetical protein
VPAAIRGDQLRQDVLVASTRPDLEDAAPHMHHASCPSLFHLLGKKLRPEEVKAHIPLWLYP